MRPWDPFIFALQLWALVLTTSAASLTGGWVLDARLGTQPVFSLFGGLLALGASTVIGLWLVRRALGLGPPPPRSSAELLGALGYALRLELIVFGLGGLSVLAGAYLDQQTALAFPIGTVAGTVLGLGAATIVGLRYTAALLRRGRGQSRGSSQ
jgi:F0F1-type ATP synthase assembly protein I